MSNKQRKLIDSIDLTDGAEIVIFYRHIGKQIPPWIEKGQAGNIDLIKKWRESEVLLGACRAVIALGVAQGESAEQIAKAQDLLDRFQQAVIAVLDMPKRAPKHRDLVLDLYTQAWAILDEQINNGVRLKDYYVF